MRLDTTTAARVFGGGYRFRPYVIASFGGITRGQLEPIDGNVTFDETQVVRSKCDLTFAVPDRVPTGVLSPADLDVTGWRLDVGVVVAAGSGDLTIPLGLFVVYDLEEGDDAGHTIQITGLDVTALIRDAELESPYVVAAGNDYGTEIAALIDDADVPAVIPSSGFTTPLLVFEEGDNRLQHAQEMALAVGWELLADSNGVIIARAVAGAQADSVWSFVEGPGCLMTALSKTRTRDGVKNIVIVTGQPAGTTAPVRGVAYDDDPKSPTYVTATATGPFGRAPRHERSQLVTTDAQAAAMAEALLAQSKGIGTGLQIDAVPCHALEPGDPIRVTRDRLGVDVVVPISAVVLPLGPSSTMAVTTRELVSG